MSGHFFFLGGDPPTPEQLEQMRRDQDKSVMETQLLFLEMESWINEMSGRELYLLTVLLKNSYDDNPWTMERIGFFCGALVHKHGINPTTGRPIEDGVPKDFFAGDDE